MKRISSFCLALLLTTGSAALASPPSDGVSQGVIRVGASGEDSYLGVQLKDVTNDSVRRLNLREERGALLTEIVSGSPAAKAGLQKDDVIVRWNGERVDSVAELIRLKTETPAGRAVKLGVMRNGSEIEVDVEMGRYADYRRSPVRLFNSGRINSGIRSVSISERGQMGVSLQSMTPQLSEYFGVPEKTGALISSVYPDSPAARAGLKAGDVVLSIGGDKIDSPSDILRTLRRKEAGPVDVRVMRDRQEMTFTVQLEKGRSSSRLLFDDEIDGLIISPPDIMISLPELSIPSIEMPSLTVPRLAPMSIPVPRIEIPRLTIPRIEIPPLNLIGLPRRVEV